MDTPYIKKLEKELRELYLQYNLELDFKEKKKIHEKIIKVSDELEDAEIENLKDNIDTFFE